MNRVYSNIQMIQCWMLMLYLWYFQEYSEFITNYAYNAIGIVRFREKIYNISEIAKLVI